MKVTALVENTTECELKAKHGLSLYIETCNHKILFDLGPDHTLFENAKKRNIDLTMIDTVIISHGHIDHGGALRDFLEINSTANIFVQRNAFEPHYNKMLFLKIGIGLDDSLQTHPQIKFVDGDYKIDDELSLFTVNNIDKCYSTVNDVLYDKQGRDTFSHEQNLLITANISVVIMGCGHAGVVNIMEKARIHQPHVCIGGFHLCNPITKKIVSSHLLDEMVKALQEYQYTRFYTCHCTGLKSFEYMSGQMPNLFYLSCGKEIEAS